MFLALRLKHDSLRNFQQVEKRDRNIGRQTVRRKTILLT
jgi:hypothetical protein